MPWLDVITIKHQLTFSFQLGHSPITIDGRASSKRRGRLDILIEKRSQRLAILELKKPGQPLDADDVVQGLSYARVLHPRPPIVVVSNGADTRCYNTHTGDPLDGGSPDEADLAGLIAAALKLAESDLGHAIATLMGPGSDVWMAAVRAATRQTLDELTGEWNDPHTPFTIGYHLPRRASFDALDALRGPRRVIAIEGAPLIGKSHVVKRGLASEVAVQDTAGAIRSDDDRHWGAVITDAGRTAIGVAPGEPADGIETTIDPDAGPSGAAAGAASAEPTPEPRQTKAALVLALLGREQGATLAELVDATGWQPHTTHAALTGLRKKGHALENRKRDTVTCYHLVTAA